MSGEQVRSAQDVYTVVGELGQGGMGRARRVRRERDGAELVFKTLKIEHADDWKAVELFEREIKVLQSLDHPGIPRFVDVIIERERGVLGFIQTLAAGEPLRASMTGGRRLDQAELEAVLRQVLEIVAYLHARLPPVIHRDITPGNVLWDGERASLIDFGSVKDTVRDSTVVTTVGTFGYMAPEQLLGKAEPASDLYGLGMTCVALAAGVEAERLPTDPASGQIDVAQAVRHLSAPLQHALIGMTRPGLSARLRDAGAALDALRAAPPVVKPPSAAWRRIKRGAAGLLALSQVAFWGAWASTLPMAQDEEVRLGGWFSGHGKFWASFPGDHLGEYHLISSPNEVLALSWSADGARLSSVARDGARLWSAVDGAPLGQFAPSGHTAWYSGLQLFARADGGVALMTDTGALYVLDGQTLALKRELRAPRYDVGALDAEWEQARTLHEGAQGALVQLVAARDYEESARPPEVVIVEMAAREVVGQHVWPRAELVRALEVRGERVYVLAYDNAADRVRVEVRGLADWSLAGEVTARASGRPSRLAISADEGLVATTIDHEALLFDMRLKQRRCSVPLQGWSWRERPVALSPDGSRMALAQEGEVLVVDTAGCEVVRRLKRHHAEVTALAFSPDGSRLASGSRDQTISIWRLK